jgi:hypothetical protein
MTSKTVNRISYGVVFEYREDMIMTSDWWSHVFIIKLPTKVFGDEQNFLESLHAGDAPAKALCMRHGSQKYYSEKQGLTSCRRFEHHVKFLIDTAIKGYANLHFLIDDIYSQLPISMSNPNDDDKRQTRALLPILGTWISSITGLALQSDLEKLQANMVQIADFVNKESNVSTKFISDTTLLVKLTNARVDNLISEMNHRSLTTLKLLEQVDDDVTQLVDFYANLTLHKFKFLTSLTELTNHYTNFLTAIGTLSRGYLPAYLFTEQILTNMLNTVQASVTKSSANPWKLFTSTSITTTAKLHFCVLDIMTTCTSL